MRTSIALLLSALLLLAGCGEDTSTGQAGEDATTETPSASPSPSKDPTADWPACTEVWKDGARLSGKYRGCRTGGKAVKADAIRCEFGKRIVTFGQHFWAAPDFRRGSKLFIHRTQGPVRQDPGYRNAMASCTA